MSNIITRGFKGTWKVITQGYFGVVSGNFVRNCRLSAEPYICQKTTTVKYVCEKLDDIKYVCQTLSTEG